MTVVAEHETDVLRQENYTLVEIAQVARQAKHDSNKRTQRGEGSSKDANKIGTT